MTLSRRNLAWHALHLGLALLFPLFLSVMIGCKRIEAEKPDYGPEVSGDAVDKALSKAVSGATWKNAAVGQYVDYDIVRRIENEETVMNLGTVHVKVIDSVDSGDKVTYTLDVIKTFRKDDGTFEVVESELPLEVEKPKTPESMVEAVLAKYGSAALSARAAADVHATKKVVRSTYHNLQEFTAPLEAPKLTKGRPGCGGLANCQMTVRYIRFDIVQWADDGTHQKLSLDFGFSLDTPFLPIGDYFDYFNGLMVLDCRSTYVPITGRTVYLRDCQTLSDLQK